MKDEQEARAWGRAQASLSVSHPSGEKPGHPSGQGECVLSEPETQDNTFPSQELGILMEGERKPVWNKESTGPKTSQRATAEGLGAEISPPPDNTALYKCIPTHPHLHTRDAHGPKSHLPSLSAFPGQRKWSETKFLEQPIETAHGPCPRITQSHSYCNHFKGVSLVLGT